MLRKPKTFLNRKAVSLWQDEQDAKDERYEHVSGTCGGFGSKPSMSFYWIKNHSAIENQFVLQQLRKSVRFAVTENIWHWGTAHMPFSALTLAIIIKVHEKRNSALAFGSNQHFEVCDQQSSHIAPFKPFQNRVKGTRTTGPKPTAIHLFVCKMMRQCHWKLMAVT